VASGDTGAVDAATAAISSPLLEDLSIDGARGVLINVTGGNDMTLFEVNEASVLIQEAAHEDANIIFGAVIDEEMPKGEMRVTVIATGLDDDRRRRAAPPAERERTSVEVGRTAHRESVRVQSQPAPSPREIPERPTVHVAGEVALSPSELAHVAGDFASPFEDEYDTPAFLRRRATEN
jgi:cell division protein FtsZ